MTQSPPPFTHPRQQIESGLLPRPRKIEMLERPPFRLGRSCVVAGAAPHLQTILATLMSGLEKIVPLPVESAVSRGGDIVLELGICQNCHREAYEIRADSEGIRVLANTTRGLRHAVQSLLQIIETLATPDGLTLPAFLIEDAPIYAWRGMHLDVARHFFPVEKVKRFVDLLAAHRMNVLHWHLTDDQGWRIESLKYPRLTEVGGWRRESPQRGNRSEGDGSPYGGFYTQQEIRDLVEYATERGVDIMPEIDIPGHSAAVLAAYPQFGNSDIPDYQPEVMTRWGIFPWLLAPKKETFAFIERLLEEVAGLFPFPFLHIGGDEVLMDQWRASKQTQEFIRSSSCRDEEGLFNYFIERAARILHGNGKRLVGWDEIVEHRPPAGSIVMAWRSREAALAALAAGHEVILTPKSHTYFDYYQGAKQHEPEAIGGLLPLEKVAEFDPAFELPPDQARLVLGAQGQLWSEYFHDWSDVEYMAAPRLCALAEITWSGPITCYEEFSRRLAVHLERLNRQGYRYRPLSPAYSIH